MTDKYAVIGNPIEHSKSPLIHAEFARRTRQQMEYGRILGDPDNVAGEVRRFFAEGGRGLNVTVPFKEQAWEIVDETHFDASFNGVDWSALRTEMRPRAAAAESDTELRAILQEMVDELGQSHFNFLPGTPGSTSSSRSTHHSFR